MADLGVSCGVMKNCETDGYEKINSMSIDELELSVRSYSCLKRAGITTVGELRSKSSEDMMKMMTAYVGSYLSFFKYHNRSIYYTLQELLKGVDVFIKQ